MKSVMSLVLLPMFLSFMLLLPISVQAIPVLQVYSNPSNAGDSGADQDTWFGGLSGTLYVAGAYSGNVSAIEYAHLVFSVPEGSTGKIYIDGGEVSPIHDTKVEAFEDLDPEPTLPPDFNNHYPFQDGVSNFLLHYIGDFDGSKVPDGGFPDWNADTGDITYNPNTKGEIKEFELLVEDFPWVHVDVIALVSSSDPSWRINPGSHDATATPEPATMLLLGSGLIGLAGLRRKLRNK